MSMDKKKSNVNFIWYSNDETLDNKIFETILEWNKVIDKDIRLIVCHNSGSIIEPKENVQFIHFKQLNVYENIYENIHKNNIMKLFFKIDLFKLCIAFYSLEKNKDEYFVFTDIDIKPMSYEELFDEKSIKYLNFYNFVFPDATTRGGYENSFMLMTYNFNLVKSLDKIIQYNLNYLHEYNHENNKQCVFDSFSIFLLYYYNLNGWIKHDSIERFILSKINPSQFNNYKFELVNKHELLNFEKRYDNNGLIIQKKFSINFKIPTKLISGPPSFHGGELTNPNIITPENFNDKLLKLEDLNELLFISVINFEHKKYKDALFEILKNNDLYTILTNKGKLNQFDEIPLNAFLKNENFNRIMTIIMINNINNLKDTTEFMEKFKSELLKIYKDGSRKRSSPKKQRKRSSPKKQRKRSSPKRN
jgi:hypothetical protein